MASHFRSQPLLIRPATNMDLPLLRHIELDQYPGVGVAQDQSWRERDFLPYLTKRRHGKQCLLVAEEDGELLSYYILVCLETNMLACRHRIHPKFRGMNLQDLFFHIACTFLGLTSLNAPLLLPLFRHAHQRERGGIASTFRHQRLCSF